MRIFIDENIPLITVHTLRQFGHEIKDIRGTEDEGMSDEFLWQMVQTEKRLLITTDKGFSAYRNQSHCGILIVRLKQPNQNKIHQRIIHAIYQFDEKDWNGLLVVMRDSVQSIW